MEANKTTPKRSALVWTALILTALVPLVIFLVRYWRARRRYPLAKEPKPAAPPQPIHAELQGLSEAEAAARRQEDQENVIQLEPPRTTRQILRENTFSIFNLSLVGIAFVQLLLGKPLDALISLGVMCLNIGLNTAQELIAKRRLRDMEIATQPMVTVIRDGLAHSINPNDVVLGDTVVAGAGDYLFVDGEIIGEGQLVMDESALSGAGEPIPKQAGSKIFAGSFCLSGRAAFITQKVGDTRKIIQQLSKLQAGKEQLTNLETIIDRILKVLLVIVAVFTIVLLTRYFRLDLGIPSEIIIDAASVIFSIAPAGLFFMILLTYTGGTADLAKLGALVRRARSVESLAQVDTICFAREGVLTGTYVEIEDLQPPDVQDRLAESRIRQILGDYTRSTSLDNFAIRAMVTSFEGNRRKIISEAPFLSVFGWSAVSFDDDDLRGVYVLGEPETLGNYLADEKNKSDSTSPDAKDETKKGNPLKRMTSGVGRLFKRSHHPEEPNLVVASNSSQDPPKPPLETDSDRDADVVAVPQNGKPKPNLFKRLINRVSSRQKPEQDGTSQEDLPKDHQAQQVELLFAYQPELDPLHDEYGMPQLPVDLIPLCRLRYSESVRPEAIEMIKDLWHSGIDIKIFSGGNPDTVAALLESAGLTSPDGNPLGKLSGTEIDSLDLSNLQHAVNEKTIFGHLSPVQTAQIVQVLRQDGQHVAVIGDGVMDIPALGQANLAITRQSSSQAALSLADIVLLDDSPQALQRVLIKGQRIVTGLLDILKLYLTEAFYLALLIPLVLLFSKGFPFKSIQNTVIATVSVTIPAVGLTFWAVARVLDSAKLGRSLYHFVLPASLTISAIAFGIYTYFLNISGEISYAQLTVTYTLVIAGLLLVIFVRPPTRIWGGGSPVSGDWRPTWMVLVLLFAFILVISIPLAQELLMVSWLREPSHYLIIMLAVSGWAFTLRLIWRIWPLKNMTG